MGACLGIFSTQSLYCAEVWECTQSLHHEQLEGKKTFCYKPGVVSVLCFRWTRVLLLWTVGKGGAGEVVLMRRRLIICTRPDSAQNKPPQSGALTFIWKCTDSDKKRNTLNLKAHMTKQVHSTGGRGATLQLNRKVSIY